MSWHYSQALEAAYSAANFSDGAPSAPLNGTIMQGESSWHGKTTDALNRSQSGTMCKPSTASLGVVPWTLSLAASRARTLAQPEKVQESPEKDRPCGRTWRELWARFCRRSSSWKTHLCLWEEVLPWSSVILPRWGMMQDGVLWERITPDFRTSEKESGYWPTPLKSDGYLSSYPHSSFDRDHSIASLPEFVSRSFKMRITPETSERLMNWPDGWTDLSASGTDKFRLWCRSHGISYDNASDQTRRALYRLQAACDHDEHEHGICLACGADITDALAGQAEDAADAREDR